LLESRVCPPTPTASPRIPTARPALSPGWCPPGSPTSFSAPPYPRHTKMPHIGSLHGGHFRAAHPTARASSPTTPPARPPARAAPPPPPPRSQLQGRSHQAEPARHEPAAPAPSPTPDSCLGLMETMPQAPPATGDPAPSAPPSPQPTAPPSRLANTPTTAPPRTRAGSA